MQTADDRRIAPPNTKMARPVAKQRWGYSQDNYRGAVTTERFEPITSEPASLGPEYARVGPRVKGPYSVGQSVLGLHLSNGTAFRKDGTREILKVSDGRLILSNAARKGVKVRLGVWEHTVNGTMVRETLLSEPMTDMTMGDARDMLIIRAIGHTSIL